MEAFSKPMLTVALVVRARRERAQRVLDALAAQTIAARLEVLLVDLQPEAGPLKLPSTPAVRVLTPVASTIGEARARAAIEAHSETVAYLEEHCVPEPGWAAAVVEARRASARVIGYAVHNGNPLTRVSRIAFMAHYGQWMSPPRGQVSELPQANVCYERRLLQEQESELAELLAADFNLYGRLRRSGVALTTEPAARIAHYNEEKMLDALRSSAAVSRVLAARRAHFGRWTMARRAWHAVAILGVAPLVRLLGLLRAAMRRPRYVRAVLADLPGILAVYLAGAAGESVGVLRGGDPASCGLDHWELDGRRGEAH